jgi:hypothetical protein
MRKRASKEPAGGVQEREGGFEKENRKEKVMPNWGDVPGSPLLHSCQLSSPFSVEKKALNNHRNYKVTNSLTYLRDYSLLKG